MTLTKPGFQPIILEDIFGWVREGNALQVRVWLDDIEHDLNIGDDHGFSLLHWAAKGGHSSIVDLLLQRGIRINSTNMGDDTALHLAVAHGHRDVAIKLINRKADLNAVNEHGNTPLHYACFWGYEQLAEELIRAGALTSVCNKYQESALDKCRSDMAKRLYDVAASVGQDIKQRLLYRDQSWKGTKTRSRDATLSRYSGVHIKELQLQKRIRNGHSGELWLGSWQGNEIVARILNLKEVTPRIARDFQEEYPRLRIFSHPNVCPVLACCSHPPTLAIVSQYMAYGSLYDLLHGQYLTNGVTGGGAMSMTPTSPHPPMMDHAQTLRLAIDVARGMSFLHSLDPLVPRFYLNSKHVVVDEDLTAKLNMADSKLSFQERRQVYSPAWMAPEALQKRQDDINVRAADMWSFGVLLWELNTREVPFAEYSPMETGMRIVSEGLRLTIPPGLGRNMSRLITLCLNEEPGKRPSFDQILPILEKMLQ